MKKLKSLLGVIMMAFVAVVSLASCGNVEDVAIVKYMAHTSLDEIENAIVTEVNKNGLSTKCYDGNQSADLITQTLTTLKDKKVKVVVCIATPVAMMAKGIFANTDTKIVFSAVSDPVGAQLVTNLNAPEANITGTSDAVDLSKQLELAKAVNPNLKKIGYIYTTTETNSLTNAARLQVLATENNYELVTKQVQNAAEITEVFNTIKNSIDALIVTDDNNVASAMTTLSNLCIQAKVPCYCAADSEIKDGGMMGYSINYTKLGTDTGAMATSLFKGSAVSSVPVKVYASNELSLFYNSNFINNSQIAVPASLLAAGKDLAQKKN